MTIPITVDTAVELFVNKHPLTDDTDFKTRETAVAYNATGMDLVWNFVTAAGVVTQTAVTPTTGGDYDWTHVGDGIYKIEMPASGGASINNDAEGVGWFTGVATGILPWTGPEYEFKPANVIGGVHTGGDRLQVDVFEIEGADATDVLDNKPKHETTIATLASQTSFTLTAGSPNDDTYNNWLVVVTDASVATQKARGRVSNYTASTKTITLAADPGIFTMAVGDTVTLYPPTTVDPSEIRSVLGMASADLDTQLDAIKADSAAILLDTGTDGVVVAAASKTGYALSATGLNLVIPADPGSTTPTPGISTLPQWIGYFGAVSVVEVQATSSQITLRNVADDGDLTTFSAADDGTTLTVGAAGT